MAEIKCPKCGEIIKLDKSSYDALLNDIEKEEIEKRVKEQERQIEEKYKAQYELAVNNEKNNQDAKIHELENQVNVLNEQIKNKDNESKLAVAKALEEEKEKASKKDQEIIQLKNDVEAAKKDKELAEKQIKESYEFQLQAKDEEIKKYKEFRLGDSTKDLGESLEQYCHDAFDEIRAVAYPRAYFEKDNISDEEGKGDFIFRDYDEKGEEIVSIMFEMKNQKDDTEHKHKNEEFFKKLDKNRTSKECEYAVLVTTLEEDSKLYNAGIVDVSHRYKKMFVVRPQFFLTIIGLIRNMAIEAHKYKTALVEYRQENLDISNFENAVKDITQKIGEDYEKASKYYESVDKLCDEIIKKIENFREAFRLGQHWIGVAQNRLPNLEIRKLTRKNPTMKAKFEELEEKKDD